MQQSLGPGRTAGGPNEFQQMNIMNHQSQPNELVLQTNNGGFQNSRLSNLIEQPQSHHQRRASQYNRNTN
jgi:hypothetical protein